MGNIVPMGSSDSKPMLDFREAAIRSGLITPKKWKRVAQAVSETGGSADDDAMAAELIQSGVISEYQARQLRAGRTKFNLGPYLITDWIGQGGMGQVYKAVHSVMGRQCAVKTLPLEKMTSESRLAFMREIRLQAGLDSPYVVRAYDAGQDGKVDYLVTEYVPGTDLRRLVRSNGPLTMEHAALVISQAAMGLQYAHNLGLVHRDVKPGNILVTPDGQAKVSDIGLAAYSYASNEDDPRAGKIVGTADYLSPEQILNPSQVGPLSDIYSLGCTLYYVVAGKVPFPGGDTRTKCRRHCEQTPWHPRKFSPDLSEDFVDVIADMMEKDPAKRIQSAEEVVERLEPWSNNAMDFVDRPIDRRSWTPPPPPKEPSLSRESGEMSGLSASGTLSQRSGTLNQRSGTLSHGSGTLSQGSGATSQSDGHFSNAAPPPIPHGSTTLANPQQGRNSLMTVLLTLAIAVPISLLVGAILGFLIRERL
ncbi:Serine/threonine-protein kinase PknB [Novipirellula galeiformis]|uniref:Serine/threonine-protein kinase PknB n=1 Tax=Novipirellula galeiformis TaxID=2528004 RepID=A0A5C6CE05_9BACT|nr:serine/threonine-protein kinase [Novipirellula galeiformis]TWU21039.1 Serine/threonine-protein kinase PknB [Novipirellula galeiformis]